MNVDVEVDTKQIQVDRCAVYQAVDRFNVCQCVRNVHCQTAVVWNAEMA